MRDLAKRTTSRTKKSQPDGDMMEWDPTPPSATRIAAVRNSGGNPSSRPEDQTLIGKRAKWVTSGELEARKRDYTNLVYGYLT
ncbi:uncharacterized protein N7515_003381 [Penicillium bovifimosum]|uniref:Uncharacterized protein n=1 Tax=Penicillium bovifimosum TaxID=126998 RepID=A0A9W9H4Z3_9EURO|nr:uncharacterized protein N7515_003381 [Penicillium bovifimosum]KAJ5138533.1 hypothetical protein N7515_003381 [Penicillium bovifimosum]